MRQNNSDTPPFLKISAELDGLIVTAEWMDDLAFSFRQTGNEKVADKLKHWSETIKIRCAAIEDLVSDQVDSELNRARQNHNQLTEFVLTAMTEIGKKETTNGRTNQH